MNPMKHTAQNDPEWYRKCPPNRSGGQFLSTSGSQNSRENIFPPKTCWTSNFFFGDSKQNFDDSKQFFYKKAFLEVKNDLYEILADMVRLTSKEDGLSMSRPIAIKFSDVSIFLTLAIF